MAKRSLFFIGTAWVNRVQWIALCVFALVLPVARAQSPLVTVNEFRLYRQDERLVLSTNVSLSLPSTVESTLQKGVPLYFLMEVELTKDRWYWFDKPIASSVRHIRLLYQPITKQWRINISAGAVRPSDTGMTLSQTFDRFEDALNAVGRVRAWPVVVMADLDTDARYLFTYRFQLDTAALPKPLQIGLIGQSDWNVSATRSIRLNHELLQNGNGEQR